MALDDLGTVARRGRVIGGLRQWEAAFEALQRIEEEGAAADARDAEEGEAAPGGLTAERVRDLRGKFARFVRRLRIGFRLRL